MSLSVYTPLLPCSNTPSHTHKYTIRTLVFSLLWFYKFHSPFWEYFSMRFKSILKMKTRGKVNLSRPIKIITVVSHKC